ncbi:MAG: GLPGLI family protein [Bacteroidota bacterium]
MRKIQLILFIFFAVRSVDAQQTSGSIIYEEKIKLQINVDGEAPSDMPALPKEQVNIKKLDFTSDVSLYFNDGITAPTDIEQQSDAGVIRIKMDRPDEKSYCEIDKGIVTEQREFMTRKFLVITELSKNEWKLTGKQKMIADYPCQEATRTESDRKISVWFTPNIPVRSGPGRFAGLPGMVLEVNINNDDILITAKEIKFGEVDASKIEKPKEGKKVTWEEFDKIRTEKMKEMQDQNGGNGNVMIKIRK